MFSQSFNYDDSFDVPSPQSPVTTKRLYKPHAKFTVEDDEILRSLVNELGDRWEEIASRMPGRNARQVRERYQNYLSPNLNTSKWTEEEDQLLLSKVQQLGQKWVKISKFFTNRTDQMMKNRFNVLKRKEQKKLRLQEKNSSIVFDSVISSPETNPVEEVQTQHITQKTEEYFIQTVDENDFFLNDLFENDACIFDDNEFFYDFM